MSYRYLPAVWTAFAVATLIPLGAAAQTTNTTAPRTAWGDPDLQGVWHSSGVTPMERPDEYQGRATLSDEETAQRLSEAAERDRQLLLAEPEKTVAGGVVGAYNTFWFERGAPTDRTSMLVDPPDGRYPALTPAGELAKTSRPRGNDSWEDRHIWERCVTRGGMPNAMFPRSYNNNIQVFQAPGYVAILHEQIHEPRIVPLDDLPPVSENIGQWNGVPRGHWDGDTLVVVTTNLDHRASALQPWSDFNSRSGSGEGMRLVERFTRVNTDALEYEIEVNDPQMYTSSWTVAYPFSRMLDPIFEYACHEGNYGMEGILTGGRAEDEAEAKMQKSR